MEFDRTDLTRRESQIMRIVYRLGRASASEVQERLPDPPGYSAVRKLLEILEDRGYLEHERDGPRYVYFPTVARPAAGRSALRELVETFFGGSPEQVVSTLLDMEDLELSDEDLERIRTMSRGSGEDGTA